MAGFKARMNSDAARTKNISRSARLETQDQASIAPANPQAFRARPFGKGFVM